MTYGFAGNSPEPGQGGSYDILLATSSSFFETNGFMITTPANDKIIWEKTRTWNIGFDTDLELSAKQSIRVFLLPGENKNVTYKSVL